MGKYDVVNLDFPGKFSKQLKIALREHGEYPLNAGVKNKLKLQSKFKISLEEAIEFAERHVHIADTNDTHTNPLPYVQNWLNALRWEVCQYWSISQPESYFVREDSLLQFTWEHYVRSGEYLAEGIAVGLLSKRLGIDPRNFYFYKSGDVRPDFAIDIKNNKNVALLFGDEPIGLEVRSRQSRPSFSNEDRNSIDNKKGKAGFVYLIFAYCYYGKGSHKKSGEPKTRVVLGDPPGEHAEHFTTEQTWLPAMQYYAGVCARIGLWAWRKHLLARGQDLLAGHERTEQLNPTNNDTDVLSRITVGGIQFSGRWFNSLLFHAYTKNAHSPEEVAAKRQEVKRRWDAGEFGTYYFEGLDETVLRLIESNQWKKLREFKSKVSKPVIIEYVRQEHGEGATLKIGADGVLKLTKPLRPGSQEFTVIEQTIKNYD